MFWQNDADRTIFELINGYRRSKGKRELVRSETLCGMTRLRLKQIATDYSHSGFRGVIRGHGGSFCENIAKGYRTPRAVLAGWSRSTGHNRNLLGDWTEGCALGEKGLWVFIGRKG